MTVYCDNDQGEPTAPSVTEQDRKVEFILHHLEKAVKYDEIAYDLGLALCSLQNGANSKQSEILGKDDRDALMIAASQARYAAGAQLGSQCLFGEIEEGMDAVSEQIFLWSLPPRQRAAYSSAFRLRIGRNIRTLRNVLHNIDNRMQNAKADREEKNARDAEIIRKTIVSLQKLGIKLG